MEQPTQDSSSRLHMPFLETGDGTLDRAFRIALDDLASSIAPAKHSLLAQGAPVVMAGAGCDSPGTRGAAITVWNGVGLLHPEVARNTLLAALSSENSNTVIAADDGQDWDAIIWAIGAWSYYLASNDRAFLAQASGIVASALRLHEQRDFDQQTGLFRGPACYADGVSGYPVIYTQTGGSSAIADWVRANPAMRAPVGSGWPMRTLSTNCLYYAAYGVASRMAAEQGVQPDPSWRPKAEQLKAAIRRQFWRPGVGRFAYLVDPFGGCEYQEGLGCSFALLFGLLDADEAERVFHGMRVTPAGLPCLWPTFPRYSRLPGEHFGRHSGTVWPPIQAFWADAAARYGQQALFASELRALASKAVRDGQFAELYHPHSGAMYGGVQEQDGGTRMNWLAHPHQSWSATGYMRAVLRGLLGIHLDAGGMRVAPTIPADLQRVVLRGLPYRGMVLDIEITGSGSTIETCQIDDVAAVSPWVPATGSGRHHIAVALAG